MPPEMQQPESDNQTRSIVSVSKQIRNWVVLGSLVVLVLLLILYVWGPTLLRSPYVPEAVRPPSAADAVATDVRALTGSIAEVTGDGFVLALTNIPPMLDDSLDKRSIVLGEGVIVESMQQRSQVEYEAELTEFRKAAGLIPSTATTSTLPPGMVLDEGTTTLARPQVVQYGVEAESSDSGGAQFVEENPVPSPFKFVPVAVDSLKVGMTVVVMSDKNIFAEPVIAPTRVIIQP